MGDIIDDMIDQRENNPGVREATRRILEAPRENPDPWDHLGSTGSQTPVCGICFALLPWENEFRKKHKEWHEGGDA